MVKICISIVLLAVGNKYNEFIVHLDNNVRFIPVRDKCW